MKDHAYLELVRTELSSSSRNHYYSVPSTQYSPKRFSRKSTGNISELKFYDRIAQQDEKDKSDDKNTSKQNNNDNSETKSLETEPRQSNITTSITKDVVDAPTNDSTNDSSAADITEPTKITGILSEVS